VGGSAIPPRSYVVAKQSEGIDKAEQFVILIIEDECEQLGSRSEDLRRASPQSACAPAVSAATPWRTRSRRGPVSKGTQSPRHRRAPASSG
jgi:hypothetical protein